MLYLRVVYAWVLPDYVDFSNPVGAVLQHRCYGYLYLQVVVLASLAKDVYDVMLYWILEIVLEYLTLVARKLMFRLLIFLL